MLPMPMMKPLELPRARSERFVTQGLRRVLSILLLMSATWGCHVSFHGHVTTGSGAKNGSSGGKSSSGGAKGKDDKAEKPKADKPKDDKPKAEKPKADKPKDDKPKAEKPKVEKPKPAEPEDAAETSKPPATDQPADPPLPPEFSRLTVPVRVPFEKLVEGVDALLPKTQAQDYKRVTKDDAKVVLDVKYKAWRDPIEAKFKGDTFTVTVPVRYAANIRGKVKNPLGRDYFPLVDGQTWGTSSSPQRMRVTVSIELDVNDEWKLTSRSKLEKIEHGPAPQGNFCAKVGIDVCTPKENLKGEVREHVERYLVPKIEEELAKADREIEKSLDLRGHASALWAALQRPLPLQKVGDKSCPTSPKSSCVEPAWLVLAPTNLGLSELSLVEGDLGVDVSLEGKLTTVTGKKPLVKAKELPKPSKPQGATAFQLRASLEVPVKIFGKELSQALSGSSLGEGKQALEIREVKLKAKGTNVTLSLETKGFYEGTLGARAKLVLDKKKGELRLDQIEFDDEARQLLDKELKGLDDEALLGRVESASRIAVGKDSKVLQKAVTRALDGALPGELEVKGTLDDVSFLDLDVEDDVLHIQVELTGSLGLEYVL